MFTWKYLSFISSLFGLVLIHFGLVANHIFTLVGYQTTFLGIKRYFFRIKLFWFGIKPLLPELLRVDIKPFSFDTKLLNPTKSSIKTLKYEPLWVSIKQFSFGIKHPWFGIKIFWFGIKPFHLILSHFVLISNPHGSDIKYIFVRQTSLVWYQATLV